METYHQRRLDRLARIPAFLDQYAAELGAVSRSPARRELDAHVKLLAVMGNAQAVAKSRMRSCTQRREALRRELYERHLRPIAAIARAERAEAPVTEAFLCPHAHERYGVLLDRAEAIAQQAGKYRHLFLRHGLPRDFVKQLGGVIDAMDGLASERAEWAGRRKETTADLASLFRRAVRLVSVLDARVRGIAGGNRALLAAWDAVRRGKAQGAGLNLVESDVA
jgi:hypothetical protein